MIFQSQLVVRKNMLEENLSGNLPVLKEEKPGSLPSKIISQPREKTQIIMREEGIIMSNPETAHMMMWEKVDMNLIVMATKDQMIETITRAIDETMSNQKWEKNSPKIFNQKIDLNSIREAIPKTHQPLRTKAKIMSKAICPTTVLDSWGLCPVGTKTPSTSDNKNHIILSAAIPKKCRMCIVSFPASPSKTSW